LTANVLSMCIVEKSVPDPGTREVIESTSTRMAQKMIVYYVMLSGTALVLQGVVPGTSKYYGEQSIHLHGLCGWLQERICHSL